MMTAQVKHLATLVAGMPEMQTAWWGWGRWCGVRRVSWPRLGAPAVMIRGGS